MATGCRIGAVVGARGVLAALVGTLLALAPAIAQNATGPASPAAAGTQVVVATDVRLGGDENQTRLIVDLSRKIDVRAFTLADPYRVIIDMPQVNFQFPPKAGEKGRGLIKAFRYGLVLPGASRMVLDITAPVRVEKAFVIDATDGQPARLVVDLLK